MAFKELHPQVPRTPCLKFQTHLPVSKGSKSSHLFAHSAQIAQHSCLASWGVDVWHLMLGDSCCFHVSWLPSNHDWAQQDAEEPLQDPQLSSSLDRRGHDFPEQKSLHIKVKTLALETLLPQLCYADWSFCTPISLHSEEVLSGLLHSWAHSSHVFPAILTVTHPEAPASCMN